MRTVIMLRVSTGRRPRRQKVAAYDLYSSAYGSIYRVATASACHVRSHLHQVALVVRDSQRRTAHDCSTTESQGDNTNATVPKQHRRAHTLGRKHRREGQLAQHSMMASAQVQSFCYHAGAKYSRHTPCGPAELSLASHAYIQHENGEKTSLIPSLANHFTPQHHIHLPQHLPQHPLVLHYHFRSYCASP